MGKTYESKYTEELSKLLRRINQGADPRLLRREAHRLFPHVKPQDIAAAEQDLIDQGFSAQRVEQLATAFVLMGLVGEEGGRLDLKQRLEANHPLMIVMAEHDLTRCFLADLEDVADEIERRSELRDTMSEFRRLTHIIEHLSAMEEHIDREEDVLYPYLKRYGWASLCRTAKSDHVYIRIAINDLIHLITTFEPAQLRQFKSRLASIVKYLAPTMREHMEQEESILYPIAVELISDDSVWKQIKDVCDEIGYCGVHL